MTTKIKAIIFDRDGVIIDSDTLVAESMNYGLSQLGIDTSANDVPIMAGKSIDKLKEILLSKWDFDFDAFRRIQREYFYDNIDKVSYFHEMIEFIKELHSENRTIALTTSAGTEGTLLILDKIGIRDMFKVIVTKEDCTKHKPDPHPYILTAKRLNVSPSECVVIEDSSIGVEAAKRAKMNCIAIPNEHTREEDFSLADHVADSIEDIKKIITFF